MVPGFLLSPRQLNEYILRLLLTDSYKPSRGFRERMILSMSWITTGRVLWASAYSIHLILINVD